MSEIIGTPNAGQKQAEWLQAAQAEESRLLREREAQFEERKRLASLRMSAPLSESLSISEPLEGPSMEAAGEHMVPLRLGLEDTAISTAATHAMTFNVRAALEMMWDDVHELEERVDKITRQAHVGMLVAHVKMHARSK